MKIQHVGSYSLKRQMRTREPFIKDGVVIRRGWRDPEVPEYGPKWMVTFTMPNMPPKSISARLYKICDACKLVKGNPSKLRPNCDCVKRVSKFAVEWLEAQTALLQSGQLEKMRDMRTPAKTAALMTWLEAYLLRGPADKQARVNALRAIVEEPTGRPLESATWETLTSNLVITWAEMRQEAGRRGWLGLGSSKRDAAGKKRMPEDGWQQIRALRDEGKLKPLETRTAEPWNTTILSYLVQAKTVFGKKVRAFAMRDLVIPELKDFRAVSLPVVTPKGHKAISSEQLQSLLEAADRLKTTNLRLWVVNQMLMRLACRPEEVQAAQPSWLEKVGARTRVVIVNSEDFTLKAGANATERRIWLPEDLVDAIGQVMNETSLIGAKHKTEARKLVAYDHSAWMRKAARLTGSQTNYILRHLGAAERMTSEGAGAAAGLLGHADESLIHSTYGKNLGTLEALSDAEILRRFEE